MVVLLYYHLGGFAFGKFEQAYHIAFFAYVLFFARESFIELQLFSLLRAEIRGEIKNEDLCILFSRFTIIMFFFLIFFSVTY